MMRSLLERRLLARTGWLLTFMAVGVPGGGQSALAAQQLSRWCGLVLNEGSRSVELEVTLLQSGDWLEYLEPFTGERLEMWMRDGVLWRDGRPIGTYGEEGLRFSREEGQYEIQLYPQPDGLIWKKRGTHRVEGFLKNCDPDRGVDEPEILYTLARQAAARSGHLSSGG